MQSVKFFGMLVSRQAVIEVEARRSNMVVEDKRKKVCLVIDFAIPYDTKVNSKEME